MGPRCPYCGRIQERPDPSPLGFVRCSSCAREFAPRDEPAVRAEPAVEAQAPSLRTTDVSIVLTGLIGTAAAAGLYFGVILPLGHTILGRLFGYGWVPKATLFLGCWSTAILVWKFLKIRAERSCLEHDVLPRAIASDIRPDNVEAFERHARSLPSPCPGSFLLNRVHIALEQFRTRRNVQEVGQVLTSQGDLDAAAVDSSYTMLRVFLWAIPILGFIGTVQGIGDAVSGFSGQVNTAADLETIKRSLGLVTASLAYAFDTTLVALVVCMALMLPMHWLQKLEDDLLGRIGDTCNQELMRRLDEGPARAEDTAQLFRAGVERALGEQKKSIERWSADLTKFGSEFVRSLGARWEAIENAARARETSHAERISGVLERAVETQARALAESSEGAAARAQALVDTVIERSQSESQRFQTALAQAAEEHRRHVASSGTQLDELQQRIAQSQGTLAAQVGASLEKAMESHTRALTENAERAAAAISALQARAAEQAQRLVGSVSDDARGATERLRVALAQITEEQGRAHSRAAERAQTLIDSAVGETRSGMLRFQTALAEAAEQQRRQAVELDQVLRSGAATQAQMGSAVREIQTVLAKASTEHAELVSAATGALEGSLKGVEARSTAMTEAWERVARGFEEQVSALRASLAGDREIQAGLLSQAAASIDRGAQDLAALRASTSEHTHGLEKTLADIRQLEPAVRESLETALSRHVAVLTYCAQQLERASGSQTRLVESLTTIDPDRALPDRLERMDASVQTLAGAVDRLEQRLRPKLRTFSILPFFRKNGADEKAGRRG